MLNSIYLNRGTHGDSSFMLGGLPSSRENPSDLSVGECQDNYRSGFCDWHVARNNVKGEVGKCFRGVTINRI